MERPVSAGLFLQTLKFTTMSKQDIKVKWVKPHPRYAYFAGDVGTVKVEKVKELLDKGYIIPIPDQEDKKDNPLPEDLPARDILYEAGFDTVEKVKEAGESLADIKGIGKGTLKQLAEYFKK